MAVQLTREGWLQLFTQMRSPGNFLSRFFTIKPGGIYNGGKVAIDIQRFGEDVAIAIKKCTGPNLNDIDEFTTKEFTPPAYGEAFPLDVCELLERMAGVDPYTAAYTEYAGQLVTMMAKGFMLIDDKIKRAVELQASQILQTGILTLTNKSGDTVYSLDFKPKASHFPTTGISWSGATADPLGDLASLAKVIRADGKINPNILIMGDTALSNFLANDDVQKKLDTRNFDLGNIAPFFDDSGATFYGFVWVGAYRFAIATYPDTFTSPQTGLPVEYVAGDKVIMLSDRTRLDMTAARVPLPLGPDPRVAGLLPGRMSSREDSFDVTPNVYCTPNGKQIMGELESRPLLIPVQIDGFGCLDTEI
jgi:hypothetical protein